MSSYEIPENIAAKCQVKYGFNIKDAIQERLSGESMNSISKKYGIARSLLSDMFKKIGIDTTNTKLGQQHLIDQEWLYEEYVNKGRSQTSIAEEVGLGKNVVSRLISKLGWKQTPRSLCDKYGINLKWLKEQVEVRNRTFSSISAELGISAQILRRAAKEEGLEFMKKSPKKRKASTQQLQESLPSLVKQIESGELTPKEVSVRFNVSDTSVRRILHENDITLPPSVSDIPFPERYSTTENWIRNQRLIHHRSVADIAGELGCSKATLDKYCRSIGCGGEVAARTALGKMGVADEWLIEQYIEKNRTFTDIANELGINDETVSRYYKQNNLPLRDDADANFCEFYGVTEEWFVEQIQNGRTTSSLAKELGTTKQRLKKLKDSHVPRKGGMPLHVKYDVDVEELRRKRIDEGLSLRSLSDEMGISRATIKAICQECNIETENEKEEAVRRNKQRDEKRAKLYKENKWKHDAYLTEQEKKRKLFSNGGSLPVKTERLIPLYEKYDVKPGELEDMLSEGMSLAAIGKVFSTSSQNIKLMCYELGYDPQPARILPHARHGISYEWFYERRINKHESFENLAKLLNITAPTVKDIYTSLNLDREEMTSFLDKIHMNEETFLDSVEDSLCEYEGIDSNYIRFAKSQIGKIRKERCADIQQVEQLYKSGNTPREIGAVFQLPEENVWRIIRENNIHKNNILEELSIDSDWMTAHFVDKKMTFTHIAEKLDSSPSMIRAACVFLGLEKPIATAGEKHGVSYEKAKEIIETPHLSYADIAKQMGVCPATSYKIMSEYGLEPPHNCLSESEAEIRWSNFLKGINVKHSTHQFCLQGHSSAAQEIDILIPDYNLGIEISPVYTHNSDKAPFYGGGQGLPKPRTYHQKKALAAESMDINLIHVFDWYDEGKIQNILRSLVHQNERVFARNTHIKKIDRKEEKAFFSVAHLQGYIKSECCYALFYGQDMVAAMSFGKPRFGNKEGADWELLRFASAPGITVVGGASKLYKHFIEKESPHIVMSYCNYDISNGNLYEALGFEYVRTTAPSYYWVKNDRSKICYSWNLITNKGVDNILGTKHGKGKSNTDLMLEEGFVRVYNCGNKVFKWQREQA